MSATMYQSSYPNGSPYHVPSAQNVQLSQFVDRLSASLGTTSGDGAGAQTSADNSAVAQQGQQQQQQLPPTHLAQPKLELEKSYKLDTSKCDAQIPYDCSSGLSHAQPNAGSTVTPPLSSAAEASGSPRPQSYNHTVRRDSPNLHAEKPPDTPGEDGGQAQYISSNLVLITNYNGSVEDVVKEHFSRALNYERNSNESGENKDATPPPIPLSQRGLPASFWSPSLQSNNNNNKDTSSSTGSSTGTTGTSGSYAAGIYTDQLTQAATLHQLAAAVDWSHHQHQYGHHSGQNTASSYAAAAAANSARSAHYNYSRFHQPATATAAANPYWAAALQGDFSAAHYSAHHYPNMTGLETSVQDSTKDLYWPASF